MWVVRIQEMAHYTQGLEFYSSEKSEKLFLQWGTQIAMVHIMVSRVSSLIFRVGNIFLEFCSSEKSEKLFLQWGAPLA